MNNKEFSIFINECEWNIKHRIANLEDALRRADIGNNACFSSPDSRESIRKRLNLILAQFEEKS